MPSIGEDVGIQRLVQLRAIPCQNCNEQLAIDTQSLGAGQTVQCFSCGKFLQVPDTRIKQNLSSGLGSMRKAANAIIQINRATDHVSVQNKIGKDPRGLDHDIALALQRGLKFLPADVPDSGRESYKMKLKGMKFQSSAVHGETYVKAILPKLFKKMRDVNLLPHSSYLASLTTMSAEKSDLRMIGMADASGKSSAYFYLSPDQKYILKSCTKHDAQTLCDILPRYTAHFEKYPQSWLPKYFGLYKVKIPGLPKQTLLIMNNWFAGRHKIHQKFDLKGSTLGRRASDKERRKSSPILKDLDWDETGYKLEFEGDKDIWLNILKADTEFLAQLQLIDYSLLVGVHDKKALEETAARMTYTSIERAFVLKHNNGNTFIYFGIVDILTRYSTKKFIEKRWYHTIRGKNASCTDPKSYAQRFWSYVFSFSENVAPSQKLSPVTRAPTDRKSVV